MKTNKFNRENLEEFRVSGDIWSNPEEEVKFSLGDNIVAEFTWNYSIDEEREIQFVVSVYDETKPFSGYIHHADELLSDCDMEWGDRESEAWMDFLIRHLEEAYNKLQ